MTTILVAFLSLFLSIGLAQYVRLRVRNRRLAPGPKGHWFYGNMFQFPSEKPWLWYMKLHDQYGDIVRVTVPGSEMVILKSLESVQDLFVKRSAIYSDRGRQVMTGEVVGLNISTFIAPYGEFWRAQRKMWHQHLGPQAVPAYYSMLHRMTLDLVRDLQDGKQSVHDALHMSLVRIMISVAYGVDVRTSDTEWPKKLSTFNNEVLATMTPGKYLVELIPALKYVPSWFPGAEWKRYGEQLRATSREVSDEPFQRVKRELAAGGAPNCVTAQILEAKYSGIAGTQDCQKWVTGSIYGAGVDTTQAILRRFIFAMVMHPEIQRRAQDEIDSVTEGKRVPRLDDAHSLPYLAAIIKECFRWQSSLPLAVPHRLMEDDEYKGYLLRKGTLVFCNVWAITHDVENYPDPDAFIPDRFLGPAPAPALDPRPYVFGIGRRVCAGRDFAEASIFTTTALLLATCTLSKPLDAQGNEVEPTFVTTGSFGNDLAPFDCRIEPRSADKVTLVRAELEEMS